MKVASPSACYRPSSAAKVLARVATLGFAISSVVTPGRARASASSAAGLLLLGLTITGGALTTAGGIVLTIQSTKDTLVSRKDRGGAGARILDAALISTDSDINLQVDLLAESPEAFAQFDREIAAGAGSSVDAICASTRLDVAQIQTQWEAARRGAVTSHDLASAHVGRFLKGIAADLVPSNTSQASLASALVSEQGRAGGGRRTEWLAEWLGVSPDVVRTAVVESALAHGIDDSDRARAAVLSRPDELLLETVRRVEVAAPDQVQARFEALAAQASALSESQNPAG